MRHRFLPMLRNMRLKQKIALLCMVLILCTTLPFGFLLYRYFADIVRESSATYSKEVMLNVGNFLDQKLKVIINRLYGLRTDSAFNSTTTQFLLNDDPRYHAEALTYYSNLFAELRFSEPFISSVFLYTPKGEFFDLSLTINNPYSFKEGRLYGEIMKERDSFLYWQPHSAGEMYRESGRVIPLVFKFTVMGYPEELFMVVNLKEQKILDYLRQIDHEEGNFTIIVNDKGQAVAQDQSEAAARYMELPRDWGAVMAAGSMNAKLSLGRERYFVNYQSTSVAPWVLVHIQSEDGLLARLRSIQVFVVAALLGSIVLGIAVAYYISRNLSRPLSNLERSMKQIRLRNFNVRFHYPYEDEVGKLGQSFNFMVEEIQDLIYQSNRYISSLQQEKERVQTEQHLKRKAELKALQSQMTPHFLYNTLDSIKWMAEKNDQMEISRMVTALASFFRIALSRGKELIALREELHHTECYLTIQQMRYGDRFTFSMEAEEGLSEERTVKLLLQPLVENAIYHGIKPLQRQGHIRISAAGEGEDMVLTVEDDGAGVHPVKLAMIRKRLRETRTGGDEGYGFYNVHDRIRLYFGEPYGLEMESSPGKGTVVRARVPRGVKEEEYA
ncbi:sensor histidine kinase [Paenibacillus sp. YN15]|uniref:sensor histidine kinase n=1 Tax=Paenibacillus sp. YN15 TaxID=1742774 RepID=UPI000DCE26C2|nr:sensor histidine kinase [Paenibacillus sp. YN15]RAV01691.1 hypothetical protein DQG13_11280 [Paenibacillus sp. YN15]